MHHEVGKSAKQVVTFVQGPQRQIQQIPAEVVPEYPKEAVIDNAHAREFQIRGKGPWKKEE